MLAFVEAIERETTITIDGYTSNKTVKGIIRDVARAVEKYSDVEAKSLYETAKDYNPDFNNPFVEASYSDGGYFFEYEECPCASRWDEKKDEMEYKDGYFNYFCIRIIK